MYKGRPLVRCGNLLYYGNLYDPYVVMMNIVSTKPVGDGKTTATRVKVNLLNNDPAAANPLAKESEKPGLGAALELACAWLDRT